MEGFTHDLALKQAIKRGFTHVGHQIKLFSAFRSIVFAGI